MKSEVARLLAAGGAALAAPCLAQAGTITVDIDQVCTGTTGTDCQYRLAPGQPDIFQLHAASDLIAFRPLGSTELAHDTAMPTDALRFTAGNLVNGTSGTWAPTQAALISKSGGGSKTGQFESQPDGWVGFRLPEAGDYRYGAIELTDVSIWGTPPVDLHGSATVERIVYSDTVGEAVTVPSTVVPEPSTFAMMALGAAGLAALRARRR